MPTHRPQPIGCSDLPILSQYCCLVPCSASLPSFFNLLLHLLIEVEALGVLGSLVAALLERTYNVCLRPLHRVANFGMPSAHMHCVVRAAECVSFCLSGTEEKVVKSGATRLDRGQRK